MKSDTVVNVWLSIWHLKCWCKVQVQLGTYLKGERSSWISDLNWLQQKKSLLIHHKSGNSVQWLKTKRNYAYKQFITIFNFKYDQKSTCKSAKISGKYLIVELKYAGNIHIYTWHSSFPQSFRKFHYKVTDKLANRSKTLHLLQQTAWVQYN